MQCAKQHFDWTKCSGISLHVVGTSSALGRHPHLAEVGILRGSGGDGAGVGSRLQHSGVCSKAGGYLNSATLPTYSTMLQQQCRFVGGRPAATATITYHVLCEEILFFGEMRRTRKIKRSQGSADQAANKTHCACARAVWQ